MEDAVCMVVNAPGAAQRALSLVCIFDGHGGQECALYSAKHLPERLMQSLGGIPEGDGTAPQAVPAWATAIHDAMQQVGPLCVCVCVCGFGWPT
jgi:serine/threonine protein phosphatase PrpC